MFFNIFDQQKIKQTGFSAIELLMVLAVVAAMAALDISFGNSIMQQTPGEVVTNQAYNYSNAVIRYIRTHQNLLRRLLSDKGETNQTVATVSTQVLVQEGFIRNNLYYQNKLNQFPCTIIWYDNHQLQALIYYRDNNDSKQLDKNQLAYGLNHMGAMLGIYQNGSVTGAAKNWSLDENFVRSMFIARGTADISQGADPARYSCTGSQIANPSYVVNVTSMLTLNNTLPKDDTIHQYPDALHDPDDGASNNRMHTDLNMDYTDPKSKVRTQSNIIFQMNPNCQMDPKQLATMQDYDPSVDGHYSQNYGKPNSLGCRNLQLAIQSINDPVYPSSNQKVMIVTGFKRGGDPNVWKDGNKDIRPYVGELVAASFQPTLEVAVGTQCDAREVGTMVKQQRSSDPTDINNIYISQLICMKSPLCEANTNGFCYMPVQNVTIESRSNTSSYTCPIGTFIDTSNLSIKHIDITGKATCHAHDCFDQPYDCNAYNPWRGPLEYSDELNTAFKSQVPLYRTITVPSTSWEQWCGRACYGGCTPGRGQIADTQDTISSIQCTNDPSKASMIITVD